MRPIWRHPARLPSGLAALVSFIACLSIYPSCSRPISTAPLETGSPGWSIGPSLVPAPGHITPPFTVDLDDERCFSRRGIALADGERSPSFTEVRWLLNDGVEAGLPHWVLIINEHPAVGTICLISRRGTVIAQSSVKGLIHEVRPVYCGPSRRPGLLVLYGTLSGTNYHGGDFSLFSFDGRNLKTLAEGPRYAYRSLDTDAMFLSMPILVENSASDRRLLIVTTTIADIRRDETADLEMSDYQVELKEVVWDESLGRFRETAWPHAKLVFPDPNTAWRSWDSYGALAAEGE